MTWCALDLRLDIVVDVATLRCVYFVELQSRKLEWQV